MRILVVCGAGASSTFVAQRLRRAAARFGLDHDAAAVTRTALIAHLGEADLVLIGPHLTDAVEDIRSDAATHHVPVIVLPEDIFADLDGSRTLRLVQDSTASSPGRPA